MQSTTSQEQSVVRDRLLFGFVQTYVCDNVLLHANMYVSRFVPFITAQHDV